MGTLVGYGILGTLLIGLIATAIICVLIYISDGCIDWGEKVCQFLVCATIIFAFFATGSLWGDLIRNRDEYIKQINDTDADTVQVEVRDDEGTTYFRSFRDDLITKNEDGTYTYNGRDYTSDDEVIFTLIEDNNEDEATVETTENVSDVNTVTPDMELVKPDNNPVGSVDLYYTRSYHTELFSDGAEYYLLVSVSNGDYPYKLSNKEYLDIINGEFPESYVVAMSMNNTPDVFMDDTIISLYPVVGKG